MESRHGYVLLLASGIFMSVFWLSEGAPLQYSYKSGEAAYGGAKRLFALTLLLLSIQPLYFYMFLLANIYRLG